jgi:hypothetical protein
MMISVNGAVVTSAASASNSHQCGARHRRINEQQREEASPRADATDAGVNVFDPAIHSLKDQPLSYDNFGLDAVAGFRRRNS